MEKSEMVFRVSEAARRCEELGMFRTASALWETVAALGHSSDIASVMHASDCSPRAHSGRRIH